MQRLQLPTLFIFCFFFSISLWAQTTISPKDLAKKWEATDSDLTWQFTANNLGQNFVFKQDTLTIVGKWGFDTLIIGGKQTLDYKRINLVYELEEQQVIDGAVMDSTSTNGSRAPSLIVPKTWNVASLTPTALVLSGGGKQYALEYQDRRSFIGKLLSNDILRGIIGIAVLLLIGVLCSRDRRNIDWKLVGIGLVLQVIFALGILKIPLVRAFFEFISSFFVAVLGYSAEGAAFMFSGLVTDVTSFGFIFAFQVLPTIVFFSAFSAILYYLGILQKIVYGFAWVMSKTMRLSGAESLAAAANIFIGQTEAPLIVKPYLDKMTKSEIMCLMTGGMATIAGGVFAAYVGYLGGTDPEQQLLFATHLLSASIMSAPAAIIAAKILFPEAPGTKVNTDLAISKDKIGANLLDAIANGTTDGLKLAVNVGAMLIAFIAIIALVNSIFADLIGSFTGFNTLAEATGMSWLGGWTSLNEYVGIWSGGKYEELSLELILGLLFAPLAWVLGVPSMDIVSVGQLLGQKTIINEFVAYASMGALKDAGLLVEQKSLIIATYALCGFANFSSIGIQIGGIGAIAPSQRQTLSELGILSLIGGTIACFLTATIAGMLIGS